MGSRMSPTTRSAALASSLPTEASGSFQAPRGAATLREIEREEDTAQRLEVQRQRLKWLRERLLGTRAEAEALVAGLRGEVWESD